MTLIGDLRPAVGARSRPPRRGRGRLRLRPHRRPRFRPRQPGAWPPAANKSWVAMIYGNVPVTREELGEFLIARGGYEKVDLLVNKRIIEVEAARRNITVTADRDPRRAGGRPPRPGHLLRRLQEARPAAVRQDALRVDRGRHQAAHPARQDVPRPGEGDRGRPASGSSRTSTARSGRPRSSAGTRTS